MGIGDDEQEKLIRIMITEFWLDKAEAVLGVGSTLPILAMMMTTMEQLVWIKSCFYNLYSRADGT